MDGYNEIEEKQELEAVNEAIKYADESNEEEFVEAGLKYTRVSELPNYKFNQKV